MAYGTELIIGFRGREKIDEILKEIGLEVKDWNYVANIEREDNLESINNKLTLEWIIALNGIGIQLIDNTDPRYPVFRTPTGNRKFSPWRLELFYDPHEMGDTEDDAILGVSLIRRYYPTFLDWKCDHGGSDMVISLDTEAMRNIWNARDHIQRVISQFWTAVTHIKTLHY